MHFGRQDVAITPDGFQQLWPARIGVDFLAQAADLAVNAAVKRLQLAAGGEFQQASAPTTPIPIPSRRAAITPATH